MAIDDFSFYTITGEEISRSSLVEQMINYYLLKLDVGETKVTDFNEGSEIRNLLEAIAVDMYILMQEQNELLAMGFIETAEGEFLDKHGANPFINMPRELGSESKGFVTFTVEDPVTSETIIPEGTLVANSETGLEYSTLNDITLPINEHEVTVAIECLTTGTDGNCGIGEIDTISEMVVDIPTITVANEKPITCGRDYEEDFEYRKRLLDYMKQDDFGSLPYYVKLGSNVKGVHDIVLLDDNDYTKKVLVNGDVKPTPIEVLTDVLEVYTNTNNIVIGHTFAVDMPNYVTVNLTLDLKVNVEISEELITKTLLDFFDGGITDIPTFEFDGFYIGESLNGSILKSNLIILDGIVEVKIYETGESDELDIIEVNNDEVCKLGEVTINQTVVE